MGPRKVAVVGSGVAGLVAAHVIAKTAEVTLYEADSRLGGHADTHEVVDPAGRELSIDTGFIVHNRRTYPTLLRLFAELGVETRASEMSLSVRDDESRIEWAGALGPRGLFPTPRTLADPSHLKMLLEVPRFHRRAKALMAGTAPEQTLREFLAAGGFSEHFHRHFMEPVVAAVWSCDPEVALDYPARFLFEFLQHHGMLQVFGSPRWRTVVGGSRTYVERVAAGLHDVRLGTKITDLMETETGVALTDGNGSVTTYEAVVVATHPDQALALLGDPTPAQREILSALPYSANSATLHTDTSVLPRASGAQASWNFLRDPDSAGSGVVVTYDLTRLQGLATEERYLLTLNGDHLIDPDRIVAHRDYQHPLYNPTSVAARGRVAELASDRIAFAGAWDGWGFHEDGARSGLAAARRLGFDWTTPVAPTPGIFRTTITHTRRKPWRRTFSNTSHLWLVDVDDLPDHGALRHLLGRIEARDHLGDPSRSIRENVETFLSTEGVDLDGGSIHLATMPRAFGYCFNPISVFWCFDSAGRPAATIVEVHNTYGDRHAYLVHPDEQGRARVDKQMYVSPFHGTDGHYELAVPTPTDLLRVAVSLHTDDGAVFSALLTGERVEAAAWRAAPATLLSSLSIRMHGIWLWARRLKIQPRPSHHQEGVR
jgi:predicted NAD/FAD-binding protein/DUF1365 family protein